MEILELIMLMIYVEGNKFIVKNIEMFAVHKLR